MSSFERTETDARHLILDCLEEIVKYSLHLFWDIDFLVLGLRKEWNLGKWLPLQPNKIRFTSALTRLPHLSVSSEYYAAEAT